MQNKEKKENKILFLYRAGSLRSQSTEQMFWMFEDEFEDRRGDIVYYKQRSIYSECVVLDYVAKLGLQVGEFLFKNGDSHKNDILRT